MIEPSRFFTSRNPLPFYPEWTETRQRADARVKPTMHMNCDGCSYRVDFQTHGEMERFISSSGWASYENGRLYCPVCQKEPAAMFRVGKPGA